MEEKKTIKVERPIGFFDRDDKELERLIPRKELNLEQWSKEDLWAHDDKDRMIINVPQFIPCNAVLSKNISARTKAVFYNIDIYVSKPYHRTLKSFTEAQFNRIILDNDLNIDSAQTVIPARVRFSKGYSDKSLSDDHSFYLMEVLIPGNSKHLILSDFLSAADYSLISILSKKLDQECLAQGIDSFNSRGFKLYFAESDSIVKTDLWELQSSLDD